MINSSESLIYVVDDDEDEHCLLQTIFSKYHQDCTLKCFSNGAELFTQLTHQLDGRLPDLILLDLHMPVLNGYEVLQLLKKNSDWWSIPVVVRTLSENDNEVNRCHDLGSNAFVVKSTNYRQLANSISALRYMCFN